MKTEEVDYFEIYTPVVQWSNVITLLILILVNLWVTKQVDYTNNFAPVKLTEKMYVEQPKGFGGNEKLDKLLRLVKGVYGLKQVSKPFFGKLSVDIIEKGFTVSNQDPCLFMK